MLLLYTNYTVIFWLLIGSNHAEKILMRQLSEDKETYNVASCAARCLHDNYQQHSEQYKQNQEIQQQQQKDPHHNQYSDDAEQSSIPMDLVTYLRLHQLQQQQQHEEEEFEYNDQKIKKSPQKPKTLQEQQRYSLLKNCSETCKDDKNRTSTTMLGKINQIQENYSLELVCRDERRLSFRISLQTAKGKLLSSPASPVSLSTASMTTEQSADLMKHLNIDTNSTDDETSKRTPTKFIKSTITKGQVFDSSGHGRMDNTIFVIKLHVAKDAKFHLVYFSDENFITIDGLEYNTTYKVTAVAVHTNNEYSVIAKEQNYSTLRRGYTPNMVKEVNVVSYDIDKNSNKLLWANIEWKPSADRVCDYDMVCFSPENDEYDAMPVEIREPRQLHRYSIQNLTFSSEYKIGIRAKNMNSNKESELLWHTFRAPPCEEWYNYNYNICAPLKPKGLSIEQTFLTEDTLSMNISWTKPEHYPEYYVVRVLDLDSKGNKHVYNLTKESTMLFIPSITIYGYFFEVHLTAYTPGGNTSTDIRIPTQKQMVMVMPDKSYALRLIFVILAPIICCAIITLTIYVIYTHRRARLKRYQERCKYFEELEKKAPIDPKGFDFPSKGAPLIIENDTLIQFQRELEEKLLLNDELEIDRADLILHEILGEGAFGLVRRGIYTNKEFGPREVAVKMLKDQPSLDEIRAFRHEIEVMKSVERHPNIVSLIGHCTKSHKEMMLLTEFCSVGNLQSFLRDEWAFLNDLRNKMNKTTNGGNSKGSFKDSYFKKAPTPFKMRTEISDLFNNDDCHQSKEMEKPNEINWGTITTYVLNTSETQIEEIIPNNSMTNNSITITGAAENKSYGYDDICTNACKCQVDVIITDIDHHKETFESMTEIDQLEKILKQKTQTDIIIEFEADRHEEKPKGEIPEAKKNKTFEMELEAKLSSKKTIEIKNCQCRQNHQQKEQDKKQTNSHMPSNMDTKDFNCDNVSKAVENKAYFNQSHPGQEEPTKDLQYPKKDSKNHVKKDKQRRKDVPKGNHKHQHQSDLQSKSGRDDSSLSTLVKRQPLSAADLLDIAKQVAMGMEYLGKNKVVHRDLAARNVLITSDRTVKIADFGLSRDIYQENIYKKTGNGKLPIKWLALESMTHQVYTTQSDVWSYGILLYEIVSLGGIPYPSIPANRLLHLLKSGYRMERPDNCGEELYKLMHSCWHATPSDRPTFTDIINELEELCERSEEQINYDKILGIQNPFQPKKIIEKQDSNDDYLQPV